MASIVDVYSCKSFKSQWKIRVKILKKWKQYLNGVETMEMIVVDDKENPDTFATPSFKRKEEVGDALDLQSKSKKFCTPSK
ncbi:unnamed protein product [Microthlaspi erraticum]|uniref:DUF223 domain-containing protein n=1 Tax=Microthlaspi erraticum TaxID=1685480 RepID=A0A6D2KWS4_9BRAS|nr:unnamed protein product [Microthlaspi erraticum]